jgi:hypothetical protein
VFSGTFSSSSELLLLPQHPRQSNMPKNAREIVENLMVGEPGTKGKIENCEASKYLARCTRKQLFELG